MASYTQRISVMAAEKVVRFNSKGPLPEPVHATSAKSAGSHSRVTGCCCRPLTHAQQQPRRSASH